MKVISLLLRDYFNTLSGGLISRRMINVSNYEDKFLMS